MNINFWPKKCSGQSRYGRYGSYATGSVVVVDSVYKGEGMLVLVDWTGTGGLDWCTGLVDWFKNHF